MRVLILGCGPSGGVPLIGCECAVCRSDEPRNRRSRPSILIETATTRVLIDTAPELRLQLLATGITDLDAVIYTHGHADHTAGLDDLRAINKRRDDSLDLYADAETLAGLERRFGYAFASRRPTRGWYRPHLIAREIAGPFLIGDIAVTTFAQAHGPGRSLGLRFGPIAYSTDVDHLDAAAFETLAGIDCWVVDCLRPTPNPAHSHLARTLAWIDRVAPRRAILTHMSHDFDYTALTESLPPGIEPAYDGMTLDIMETYDEDELDS